MNEQWKEINGFPGYEVSNMGRVRSLDRFVPTVFSAVRMVRGKMLSPFFVKSTGYVQVNLTGKARFLVHRLVAASFCDGYFDGAHVNHKNGVRDDNRAENLEWVTVSENLKHAYRELGITNSMKGKFSAAHSTSKSVISRCIKTGVEQFYGAAMDAVREGFHSSSISRCCNGKSASHKGREWRYASDSFGAEHNVNFRDSK